MSEEKKVDLEFEQLERLLKSKKSTVIYLCNGYQMAGTIENYDSNVIIVRTEKGRKMVYRHNVSSFNLE